VASDAFAHEPHQRFTTSVITERPAWAITIPVSLVVLRNAIFQLVCGAGTRDAPNQCRRPNHESGTPREQGGISQSLNGFPHHHAVEGDA